MNKPAPKEPSMDEILSSIRQIIADDDAAGSGRRPSMQAASPPMQATPARPMSESLDRDLSDMLDDIEPLALTPAQMVNKPEAANTDDDGDDDASDFSFESLLADAQEGSAPEPALGPRLVETDDIEFTEEAASEPAPEPVVPPPPQPTVLRMPEPVRLPEREPQPARPEPVRPPPPSIAAAAPMPDRTLSSDLAGQLLEPATQAAVRSSMGKLTNMGIGNGGMTIESMMRDMLRPMLKEWLDENLPAVVERLVEKEIGRISRGD